MVLSTVISLYCCTSTRPTIICIKEENVAANMLYNCIWIELKYYSTSLKNVIQRDCSMYTFLMSLSQVKYS